MDFDAEDELREGLEAGEFRSGEALEGTIFRGVASEVTRVGEEEDLGRRD